MIQRLAIERFILESRGYARFRAEQRAATAARPSVVVRGRHGLGYARSAPAEEDLPGSVRDALDVLVRGVASRPA